MENWNIGASFAHFLFSQHLKIFMPVSFGSDVQDEGIWSRKKEIMVLLAIASLALEICQLNPEKLVKRGGPRWRQQEAKYQLPHGVKVL